MKRISTTIFFLLTAVPFLFSISASAQHITYLDENNKQANAENYTYKRVIKYKESIINPNIGTGHYGGITSNPTPSGLHICSLIDYYKTGEPARVANVITLDTNCTQWVFDGQAVIYYKSGNIARKEPWKAGKLHGILMFYNEDGTVIRREQYENGKLIEENKFSVSENSPLVGTWKYIEYDQYRTPKKIIVAIFSQNGILEITVQDAFLGNRSYLGGSEKTNWKYVPKSDSSGVLEQYQGDEMLYRGNVRWLNRNQFEYTNTFHQNANMVGQQYTYSRQ